MLAHCRDVTRTGATSEKLAVWVTPFNVPVTVAGWFAVKEPAVALKVALAALAASETVAGTVMPAVELKAIVVCAGTGLLIKRVQAATAPGPRLAGVHKRLLSTGTPIPAAVPRPRFPP